MRRLGLQLSIAGVIGLLSAAAIAQDKAVVSWPDSVQSRMASYALMQSLNAQILASTSATKTLENWCRDHHMADNPLIVATQIKGEPKQPTQEQLNRLQVEHAEALKYRRVQLSCGAHVLSVADNWYVPSRLTPEMNRTLENTDTPFGVVVKPLAPFRKTIAMSVLWQPLPTHWEMVEKLPALGHSGQALDIPKDIFEHQAVLYTDGLVPFSEVDEVYQGELLRFDRHSEVSP